MGRQDRDDTAGRTGNGAAAPLPPPPPGPMTYYPPYHEPQHGPSMPPGPSPSPGPGPGPGSHPPHGPPPPFGPHHPPPDYAAAKQYQDYMASYGPPGDYAAWAQAMGGYYGGPPPYQGYPPYGAYPPPHPYDAPPTYYPSSEEGSQRRRRRDGPRPRDMEDSPQPSKEQAPKFQAPHHKSSHRRKDRVDPNHRGTSGRAVVSPFQRNAVFKQNGMLDTERQGSGKSGLGPRKSSGLEKKNGSAGSSESGPVGAPGDRADSSRSTRTGAGPKQETTTHGKTRGSSGSNSSGQATYKCMHPTRTKNRLGEAKYNQLRNIIVQQQDQFQGQVNDLYRLYQTQLQLTGGKDKAKEISKEMAAARATGVPASTSGRVSPPSDDPDEVSNSKPSDNNGREARKEHKLVPTSSLGPKLWSKSSGFVSRDHWKKEATKLWKEEGVANDQPNPSCGEGRGPRAAEHRTKDAETAPETTTVGKSETRRHERTEVQRASRPVEHKEAGTSRHARHGSRRRRSVEEPARGDDQPPAKRLAVRGERDGEGRPQRAQSPDASAPPHPAMGPYDPHAAAMAAYHHHQQQQQQQMMHHMAMSGRMPPPGAPYPPAGQEQYNPEYMGAVPPAWSAYYANAYASQRGYPPA